MLARIMVLHSNNGAVLFSVVPLQYMRETTEEEKKAKKKLFELMSNNKASKAAYNEWVVRGTSVYDILMEYPSINIPFGTSR